MSFRPPGPTVSGVSGSENWSGHLVQCHRPGSEQGLSVRLLELAAGRLREHNPSGTRQQSRLYQDGDVDRVGNAPAPNGGVTLNRPLGAVPRRPPGPWLSEAPRCYEGLASDPRPRRPPRHDPARRSATVAPAMKWSESEPDDAIDRHTMSVTSAWDVSTAPRLIEMQALITTTTLAQNFVSAGTDAPFSGLEAAFDPGSRRHLTRTGVGPGSDCWEVGAGSGSVGRWLADQVWPSGSVLATDIDLSARPSQERPNLRVKEHDVVEDPNPGGGFHCIHARLVLGHLPGREDALARLATTLAPGGWLVIEDLDLVLPRCPEAATPSQRLVHRVRSAFARCLSELRGDAGWADSLPSRLRHLGLAGIGSSTHVALVTGGSMSSSVERANLLQVEEHLVASGVATEDEIDRCIQLFADPEFQFDMPVMVSAWGRRPETPTQRHKISGRIVRGGVPLRTLKGAPG